MEKPPQLINEKHFASVLVFLSIFLFLAAKMLFILALE